MNPETSTLDADHGTRPHAERSASQLGPLALCAGYRPEKNSKTHWVTAQGNRGHAALDTDDTSALESGFEEKMVQLCEDYVATLPKAESELREIRVETIEGRWGYIDRIRFRVEGKNDAGTPTIVDVVDWKFVKAKEVTDAEVNLQGKDYVIGVFDSMPSIAVAHVHFVMPRFGSVTTASFYRSDLPRLKLEVLAVLNAARRTDRPRYRGATLTPHFDVCRFCAARWNCKALVRIYDQIGRQYDPDGYGRLPAIPDEVHSSKVKDPAHLGQLRVLAGLAQSWAASVYHNTTQAALDGVVPAGYSLDFRKGNRKLVNPAGLLLAAQEFGIRTDQLLDCADVTVGKLEELIKESAPRGAKAHRVREFHDRCADLDVFERGEDSPTLKKQS